MAKESSYLSRKQINDLLSNPDLEKESKLDSFDQESLQGWRESGLTPFQLKKLDKKFKKSIPGSTWGLIIASVIIVALTSILLTNNRSKPEAIQKINYVVKLDNTDIQLPESIDTLTTIPKNEQIQVTEIIQNQKNIKAQEEKPKNQDLTLDIPFPLLTLEPLPVEIEQKPTKVSNQQLAKEIYLNSFKAIDYSSYRSKPVIPIEQIILTGVPANFENQNTIENENPEIRKVDIPYVDYLNKSLGLVNKGKWKPALSRFEEILKIYPDDVNARFYAGWCYFNLGQYEDACIYFSACLQLPYSNFNEESQWYLAQSRLKNNEKSIAKELFVKIKNEHGFYAKQADKILKSWK